MTATDTPLGDDQVRALGFEPTPDGWVPAHDDGGSLIPVAALQEIVDDELELLEVAPDEGTARERSSRLGALSRSAALERIAATPTMWLVEDVLTSGDYGTLAGPKGVGKSLALEDLAVSIALGEPWFGRFASTQGTALVLTCEEREAHTWKRLDAIARAKGHEPEELEGTVFVHPIPFSAITDIKRLRAEVATLRPAVVVLDPAYKYMAGAKSSDLFNMGAVLTPVQVACQENGAALLVGHHYNRREGAAREERISGAGLLEWARVIITMDTQPHRAGDESAVLASFEVSGNSLDPIAFRLRRSVVALEDGPNPDLSYSAEVIAEGAEARPNARPSTADRVRAVLGHGPDERLTVSRIGDRLAEEGQPLKARTIQRALAELIALGEADGDNPGPPTPGVWWLT